MEDQLIFKEECFKIVGLCMKVHRKLGGGFKEVVYKDALEVEFMRAEMFYQREKRFSIEYDGVILRHSFVADFILFNCVIVEIKAGPAIFIDSFRQTLNYIRAAHVRLGILANFGSTSLQFKRIVCNHGNY